MKSVHVFLSRLREDRRGLALIEFAYVLPILLTMTMTGAELTNYITTRMRVSQLALHIADNAARMGVSTVLNTKKKISETDINDLLVGGGLQGGDLDLYTRGRVIVSDLEPVANPNTTNKFKIVWQRCRGDKTTHASGYGTTATLPMNGMGPAGRQVTAQANNATMFVEVYYEYKPLVGLTLVPSTTITEIASMSVRETRDLSQIYNSEGATVSSC